MLLKKCLDEERAKKAIQDYLKEHNRDYFVLTREAHCALYGTTPDLVQGHINWIQHGIPEPHVVTYMQRLGRL